MPRGMEEYRRDAGGDQASATGTRDREETNRDKESVMYSTPRFVWNLMTLPLVFVASIVRLAVVSLARRSMGHSCRRCMWISRHGCTHYDCCVEPFWGVCDAFTRERSK